MPRKKKKSKPSDTSSEATLKQLQTQLTDPRITQWLWSGARGVRERIMRINFGVLRSTVDKVPLLNRIINTRIDQVLPYCTYAEEDGDRGLRFKLADRAMADTEYKDSEIDELVKFFEETGFDYDPEREDDLQDYIGMMVRELLVVDQIATEMQFNRLGDVRAFWALDGATIARVTEESDFARGVRFVQTIDQKIYNEFTGDMLIFDYKYKRADIRYRGFGYSPVEQAIDIITTLLFGYNYMRDQLVRDKVPRGFISIMGDVGKPEMDAIRNYWYSAMSSAGAKFNIPILPSGKDGVGMDFKTIGQSNKDLEYHKLMTFISSIIGSVFGMDLLEMGIKTDDTSQVIGENPEPRITSSKDRGLHSILMFIQQHMNKVLRKVGDKYKVEFVGMIQDDESKKAETRNKQIAGWRTIDEIREEDGLEPFNEDWSKMPLQQSAVQLVLADKQAQQMGEMGQPGEEGEEGYGDDNYNDPDTTGGASKTDDSESEKATKQIEKSVRSMAQLRKATHRSERVVTHVIK